VFPKNGTPPPLSPVLLAGIVARPLPPQLLQPFLDAALAAICRRHPGLFERLSGLDNTIFLIDPTDLPLVFILEANLERPKLTAARDGDGRAASVIRGPLMTLIDLAEGRVDGDALFFSRELSIEGDTEAVVALRNAVDDSDIDVVGDILSLIGPLAPPLRGFADLAAWTFDRMQEDLEMLLASSFPKPDAAQHGADQRHGGRSR